MNRFIRTIIVVLLLSSCLMSCNNLNLQEGIQSFKVQDYRKAFIRLKPLAIKGQPDAQYAVGYMYYYGQGVVEDRKQAWYWINMAANAGQADAVSAVHILQKGSLEKKKIFTSGKLHHYPVVKDMY